MTGQNQSSNDMKKRRLTDNEWQSAREVWETDPRTGFAWLHAQLDLPVSRSAVSKRAAREGWEKQDAPEVIPQENITPVVPPLSPTGTSETGRPTEYKAEYDDLAYRLMLLGLTRSQLADALGVCERTIYNWCDSYPSFLQSIRRGAVFADAEVAESLFNRARGAVTPDVHVALHEGQPVITPLEKHYPPETAAARLWLTNRQPQLWRSKVEIVEQPEITVLDKEEMDRMYDAALEKAAQRRDELQSRSERLGLTLDGELTTDTDD